MLTELKRCNSVGNINGILFLISIIAGKEKITKTEIRNRCSLENRVVINCPGALAFLNYLGLIIDNEDVIMPEQALNDVARKEATSIINELVVLCINRLASDGIFDNNATVFDVEKGRVAIKKSIFPLEYAAIRNFLIAANALENVGSGEICITDAHEADWTEQISKRRRKVSLEQLLRQQADQNKRGLEAEEFVLKLERERLPHKAKGIKRVSDFDVAAGFDIVSYDSDESPKYDRFIEVKCYIGEAHFYWSENEADVARIKGERYILCLVDYLKMGDEGYLPEYIQNPYFSILNNEDWIVNPSSYKVQKI